MRILESVLVSLGDICRINTASTGLKPKNMGQKRNSFLMTYVPKTIQQVFSKVRDVIVDSRKSFSDMGFFDRP